MNKEQYENQFILFKEKSKLDERFVVEETNKYMILNEDTYKCSYDQHYIYHTAWAARRICENKPKKHVDISSSIYFSTIVSAFVPVDFFDYRPVELDLENYNSGKADLTCLPHSDNSIQSLSCMHVLEHIGLGRYGDAIDPLGDIVAANELKRVLAPGGILYMVLPVASINKICFNAHRIYSFKSVLSLFNGLVLKSNTLLSLFSNKSAFIKNASENDYNQQTYGCGCFEFQKI
jgi:hypothetical protein